MTADAVYFIMYIVPSPLASNRTNQNYLCNSYYAPILVIPNLPVNCFLQSMEPVHSANSTFSSQRTQSPSSHLLLAADAAACFFCSCWLMHAWPSYQVIRSILWWTALARGINPGRYDNASKGDSYDWRLPHRVRCLHYNRAAARQIVTAHDT